MLQNENKLDEMSIILERFMKFVPTLPKVGTLSLPHGDCVEYDNTKFAKILLGGDQLTVARVRGTQALRKTESKAVNRLEGIAPVTEDWHARMNLVKVYYNYLCTVNTITCDVFFVGNMEQAVVFKVST